MKIIITGAGDVGLHLAKGLAEDEHHITLIDYDENTLTYADSIAEVITLQGSATSFKTLLQADVANADLVIAVTSVENTNLVTASLAKQMGARTTVARVANDEYVGEKLPVDLKKLGIDHVIYPEGLAALEIANLIRRAAATDMHEFEDGKLTLLGLKLDQNSGILNRALQEVMRTIQNVRFRIVLVKRGDRTIIPTRDIKLQPGDQIIVIARSDGVGRILKLTGKDKTHYNNIMILGGGKIGRVCATLLEKEFNVKLIETDIKRAYELADVLDETLILRGDGRDMALLAEEGIAEMDAFIALTGNAETNIIAALMAKQLNVKKTIAHVENAEYNQLSGTIGINTLVNKKLIAASDIKRLVHRANVVELTRVHGMEAEVVEFVVPPGSLVTKEPVRDLKFPKGAIMGGYIRGDQVEIVIGDTHIQPDDRVVVFSLPNCLRSVESFFAPR